VTPAGASSCQLPAGCREEKSDTMWPQCGTATMFILSQLFLLDFRFFEKQQYKHEQRGVMGQQSGPACGW